MAELTRTSPLAHYADRFAECRTTALGLAEIPFATQLTLRLDPASIAARQAARVLGGPLPYEPNTTRRYGRLDVLWLGPDEWLVVTSNPGSSGLEAALREAFAEHHATVVDVSAQRTIIEIGGPAARAVLAKGCALDLHASAFGPGTCAQTLTAGTQVILLAVRDEPRLWLFVRASFADHLAAWLLDASLEERVHARLGAAAGAEPLQAEASG